MNLKQLAATAGFVTAISGAVVVSASAQAIIGYGGSSIDYVVSVDAGYPTANSSGLYTFIYTLSDLSGPSAVKSFTFDFDGSPTTFASNSGAGGFSLLGSANGIFSFSGTGLTAGESAIFTFTSTYAPKPDAASISSTGAGPFAAGGNSAVGPGIAPDPPSAPEPGTLTAFTVGGLCLGLVTVGRRRQA